MFKLDLNPDERHILSEILLANLSDLRMEIAATDILDFRLMLMARMAVLQKTLDALGAPKQAV